MTVAFPATEVEDRSLLRSETTKRGPKDPLFFWTLHCAYFPFLPFNDSSGGRSVIRPNSSRITPLTEFISGSFHLRP